jgi:hypothetical protein
MASQPLSREDNAAKTSTTKTRSKTSTAKTSTTKTVAKTATRRRTATKSLPIVDFPTPDNVHSLPIQPNHPANLRLATPSLDSDAPQSVDLCLLSQLASCRQTLSALQAESEALHHTMDQLAAIAREMDVLAAKSKSTKSKSTKSKSTFTPEARTPTVFQDELEAIAQTPHSQTPHSQTPHSQTPHSQTPNYWGNPSHRNSQSSSQIAAKPTVTKRSLQLPNLNPAPQPKPQEQPTAIASPISSVEANAEPMTSDRSETIAKPRFHSSSLRTQHRIATQSLTRQNVEYYAGYSPSATQALHSQPVKPAVKPTVKPAVKPAVKPSFRSQPVVKPAFKSAVKPVAMSFNIAQNPTEAAIVLAKSTRPQIPDDLRSVTHHRPKQIRLQTARRRYTIAYLYQVLQQLIPIPKGESAILFDALCWTLSAIGLRMTSQLLINLLPILSLPLNFLMLCPALLATYLAFCIPKSSSTAVYRCLLVTLGFFIGGKLI